jgi:hypothetical protein
VLMSSIRGLPSDYAVLYCMLDAQIFLSLNPYFRESTVCPKHDSLVATQVTHQGYKHLDLTLFTRTGCDYIFHGMSHNPSKTTGKISSTRHFFLVCRSFFSLIFFSLWGSLSLSLSLSLTLSLFYKKQSSTKTSVIIYLNILLVVNTQGDTDLS